VIYRVPPFEMERLMRVVRRHPIDGGRIRFSFLRLFPAMTSPEPFEAGPEDGLYHLLMQDLALFDGRGEERWGDVIHRARQEGGFWVAIVEAAG
jgi:hypothetical protein